VHTKYLNLGSPLYYELDRNPPSPYVGILQFYLILKLHLCHNFNTILIILYIYGITLIYINILPLIFDNLHSTLHVFEKQHFLSSYELTSESVRSESLTTVTMKNTLFRDVPPCSLVRIYGRFGRNFSLSLQP